jgi:hypothetical protein
MTPALTLPQSRMTTLATPTRGGTLPSQHQRFPMQRPALPSMIGMAPWLCAPRIAAST